MRLRKWEELADKLYDQARRLAEQAYKLKEDGFDVWFEATPFAIELLKAGCRISAKEFLLHTSLKFMGIEVRSRSRSELISLRVPTISDLEESVNLVVNAREVSNDRS